jgi:hypothetical protein
VVADNGNDLPYDDVSPRESLDPKGQPGAERTNVPPRAIIQKPATPAARHSILPRTHKTGKQSLGKNPQTSKQWEQNNEGNSFRNAQTNEAACDLVALTRRSEVALFL